MPADSSTDILVQGLSQGRLLKPAQERELPTLAAGFADPHALADELVRRGWLTAFQASSVLAGRTHELVLGQYVLLEKLGEGGMGAVFKAYHRRLDRLVAVKLIRKERLSTSRAVDRFQREARLAAKLAHPNVVTVYDADEVQGTHFLVMEYVEGQDLGKLVRGPAPLPIPLACDYLRQAACGLAHAHEKGLVHRDIKPSNLLAPANGGPLRLMDLGLARMDESEDVLTGTDITQEGAVMGTPDYMAPEQIRDPHHVDIRADIYSLGCTFYHLLAQRPPFPGVPAVQKFLHHQLDEPEPLERLRPDVAPDLAAVVRRMMAKRPEDRYQTPLEVVGALAPFCQAIELTAVSVAEVPHITAALPMAPAPRTVDEVFTTERVSSVADFPAALPVAHEAVPLALPVQPVRRRGLGMMLAAVVLLLLALGGWQFLSRQRSEPALAQQQATRRREPTLAQQPTSRREPTLPTGRKEDAQAHMDRGDIAYGRKDYDQAIVEFTEVIRLDPQAAKAFNNRGNAYFAKRETARAIADFTRAIQIDPQFAIAYNNRANAYSQLKEYDKAIADYSEAIRCAPQLAQPYYNRGNVYLDRQQYDKAIVDYNEALRLEPGFALAYNNRGNAYRDRGDHARALENYNQALKLDPRSALALYNRGLTYSTQAIYDKALADLNQSIQLDGQFARSFLQRGNVYYVTKEPDKALADYTEAMRLDPKLADAYNNRGTIYLDRQEATKAIADYDKAIQLAPSYALAYLNRSKAHALLGNQRQADDDRTRALKLDPNLLQKLK